MHWCKNSGVISQTGTGRQSRSGSTSGAVELQVLNDMHCLPVALGGITKVGIRHNQANGHGCDAATTHFKTHRLIGRRGRELQESDCCTKSVTASHAKFCGAFCSACNFVAGRGGSRVKVLVDQIPIAHTRALQILGATHGLRIRNHKATLHQRSTSKRRGAADIKLSRLAFHHEGIDQLVRIFRGAVAGARVTVVVVTRLGVVASNTIQSTQAVIHPLARGIAFQRDTGCLVVQRTTHLQPLSICDLVARGSRRTLSQSDIGGSQVPSTPGQPENFILVLTITSSRVRRSHCGLRQPQHLQRQQDARQPVEQLQSPHKSSYPKSNWRDCGSDNYTTQIYK